MLHLGGIEALPREDECSAAAVEPVGARHALEGRRSVLPRFARCAPVKRLRVESVKRLRVESAGGGCTNERCGGDTRSPALLVVGSSRYLDFCFNSGELKKR